MKRTVRLLALLLLFLGVFWAGRESTHGIGAFWEQWWCPIPIVLILLGVAGQFLRPRSSSAA